MRVGNFSLLIPEGRERDSGHVEIAHGTVYRLQLNNHWYDRRCDAEVVVDGKTVGLFRVEHGSCIILERPAEDTGRFTFFRTDSEEAGQAGQATIAADQRGLIQVRFKPEKKPQNRVILQGDLTKGGYGVHLDCCEAPLPSNSADPAVLRGFSFCDTKTSSGITGLTGNSNQTFVSVAGLDYDPAEGVVISLRLVCGQAVRPLVSTQPKGNQIPAPVG